MLNNIVFICGAALMALEIVAARVLAPHLGNSIFVWGADISVVLLALSIGYWLGGQVADRFGTTRTMAPVIAGAGLLTVVVPPISAAVLPAAANLGPRLGSLVGSLLVFFLPALLLAMISPLGVRLAAASGMERIGRSAGGLYAISTAGSIFGTLATAFYLIPILSIETLIVGIGFVLFVTAGMAALLPRMYTDPALEGASDAGPSLHGNTLGWVTAASVALGVALGAWVLIEVAPAPEFFSATERVLMRKDTQYHRVLVTEDADERHLRFDKSHQSAMALDDPYESSIRYPSYFHLALALKPDAKRIAVLGLGGGTVTKRMWRDYPEISIDTVEIDPVVVDVARDYFELPQDERLSVTVEDGRRYLQTTDQKFDIIIVDAYYADALPFHLTTEEFFREAKSRLNPGGVIVYNVISSVEGARSDLFRGMYKTASSVFENLWVFPIGLGEDGLLGRNRNIIVLATDANVSEDELRARIADRIGGRVTLDNFEDYALDLYTGRVDTSDVPKLTDSHAPVDSLIEVN